MADGQIGQNGQLVWDCVESALRRGCENVVIQYLNMGERNAEANQKTSWNVTH